MSAARDVERLGQVFTPAPVVDLMLALRERAGRVLEPSSGQGAFASSLPGCVAIEYDWRLAGPGVHSMDFFAYPDSEKFDTVIGNPPYVRFQDISDSTRSLLDMDRFDQSARQTPAFMPGKDSAFAAGELGGCALPGA